MIAMVLLFLIGSYVLGIAWIIIFWAASFVIYLVALVLSWLGIRFDISGDRNVWLLFWVVFGISWYVYHLAGECGLAAAIFVFFTGAFMLFRSADIWRVSG